MHRWQSYMKNSHVYFIGLLIYIADITIYRLEQNQGKFLYLWTIFTHIDKIRLQYPYYIFLLIYVMM